MKGPLRIRKVMAMSRVPRNLMTAELRRQRPRCRRNGTLVGRERTDAGWGFMFRRFRSSPKDGGAGVFVAGLLIALAITTAFASLTFPAHSQPPQPEPVQHVVIAVNKSVTIPVSRPFSSAVVGSAEIADALPMTDL